MFKTLVSEYCISSCIYKKLSFILLLQFFWYGNVKLIVSLFSYWKH